CGAIGRPLWYRLVVSSGAALGEDWMRLRGPGATGVSTDTGLPIHWSATSNVVWKTALPGKGASSPITLKDKIYLTAYTGYGLARPEAGDQKDLTHHVLCLNRKDGVLIWDKTSKALLPDQDYTRGHIDLHGYASATPVSDGESLFSFFGRSGVLAYTLDGEPLWHKTVGTNTYKLGWGSGASPIVYGDLLIVNASIESDSLVALNTKTGQEVWRATGIFESWSTPLVVTLPSGKNELVVNMNGKVLGLEPTTGKQLWECEGVQDYVVPMTVADDKGVVYISGGRGATTRAIRAGGRGDVTATHLLWKLNRGCKVPSPLYHDGLLYWVSNMEKAACVDAKTGELHYYKRLERGAFYGSAVMAEGRIYAVSKKRGTVVLAAGKEFKQLARNYLDDDNRFNGTPVISNSQILLRSDRFLYCIGKQGSSSH
ncbi:MAG: PQQ-binding-like beta-propeller repeat protein, partial [Kiritimatiellae bacterium]|nr:PQQ-binding-like beta-propeller repeat protein [Kiritimatiellia bacterium]